MRKSLILSVIAMAFLCLAQNASAQYIRIHRDHADFVDNRGFILSDPELIDLVGEDVFYETVVGARKQYKTGQKLFTSGLAGMGVGIAGMVGSAAMIAAAGPEQAQDGAVYFQDEDKALVGGVFMTLSAIATTLGGTAFAVGLPFKVIGQSRLNWVENDFNDRARGYSFQFGPAPHGVGLTLNF